MKSHMQSAQHRVEIQHTSIIIDFASSQSLHICFRHCVLYIPGQISTLDFFHHIYLCLILLF